MSRRIVHVIGTGTIGEPLIGLLCNFKDELGIDEITFNKYTPLTTDRSKVSNLLKRGARLSTNADKIDGFNDIGITCHPCNSFAYSLKFSYRHTKLLP